ncbi:hypothetical protein [Brachyspira sp.]
MSLRGFVKTEVIYSIWIASLTLAMTKKMASIGFKEKIDDA